MMYMAVWLSLVMGTGRCRVPPLIYIILLSIMTPKRAGPHLTNGVQVLYIGAVTL